MVHTITIDWDGATCSAVERYCTVMALFKRLASWSRDRWRCRQPDLSWSAELHPSSLKTSLSPPPGRSWNVTFRIRRFSATKYILHKVRLSRKHKKAKNPYQNPKPKSRLQKQFELDSINSCGFKNISWMILPIKTEMFLIFFFILGLFLAIDLLFDLLFGSG